MSVINPLARQLAAKLVFVGPGLSGKTSSLQYIHSRLDPATRGQLISLETDEDRTLFFDFLPLRIERVHGLGVRLHLYTVPGQVFYAATRKLVLNGADGIVFVADAQRARREANIESLQNTREHLLEQGLDLDTMPLVFQYNKRDLPEVLTRQELHDDLNPMGAPEFDTVATEGTGILEALRASVRAVVDSLNANAQVKKGLRPYLNVTEIGESQRGQTMVVFPEDAPASTTLDSTRSSEPRDEAATESSTTRLEYAASPTPGTENASDDEAGKRPTRFSELALTRRGESSPTQAAATSAESLNFASNTDNQAEITTERPVAGVSFSELWDVSQRAPVAVIESCISARRYSEAVHHAATALALSLNRLPGQLGDGMGARAMLLGLDGREYLRLCRLASQPDETISARDALFALHMLVSAQLKVLASD